MAAKPRCIRCGRRGRRRCPALGGWVCPTCCATGRGSEIACAADCPYFPFATVTYDQWLALDRTWMPKAARYVADHLGKSTLRTLMAEFAFDPDADEEEAFDTGFGLAVEHALFRMPDQEGKTLADRWEAEGWRGMTHDERVMTRYRRRSFPTVIEVQRVLSDHSLECIDALEGDPTPFVLFDRNTAARALRFDQFLVWVCHYPHYSRVGPTGVEIPRRIAGDFARELRHRASEAGAAAPKEYLLSHYTECCRLVTEVCQAQYQSVMRETDARQFTSVYDIPGGRDAVAAVLDGKPDFEPQDREPEADDPPGTHYYVWLQRGESRALDDEPRAGIAFKSFVEGVATVGSVKLLPDRLVVEAFTLRKHRFAKSMIERHFGDLVSLRDETVVDLWKRVAERRRATGSRQTEDRPADDRGSRVPIEVERELVGRMYQDHYTEFLNDPVPALEGMTPREAARDPAMRPRLIELMKLHVHQVEEVSRRKGVDLRIGWVLEELGLTELL